MKPGKHDALMAFALSLAVCGGLGGRVMLWAAWSFSASMRDAPEDAKRSR